jgi:site-specific DNA recombinase
VVESWKEDQEVAMTTATQLSTAVGYLRVSTPGQAGERHVSLDVQQAAFQEYCRTHHLTPVATFTDVGSGRKDDRAQYRAMLAHIARHGVGNVVVLFLDRFGRNPREILRRYWELQEQGITVCSVNEDLREELMLLLRAGIAGQESRRTGERVQAALHRAAEEGRHVGSPPYGYSKVREGSIERWVQVPEEAAAIRQAYRLAVEENKGYKSIADELNRQGFRMKAERGGKPFAAEKVKFVLNNPALAGQMRYGKEGDVKEGVYPAILSPDEWQRLKERLRIRREGRHRGRTDSSAYLLSGMLRCGECGGAMVGHKWGRWFYYRCHNHEEARALCVGNTARKEALETAVLAFLGQYDDPDKVRELLEAQDTVADTRAEEELARVTARVKELETGMLNDLDRLDRKIITEAEYTKRAEVRRQEQPALQARKGELEAKVAAQRDREAQAKAVPVKVRSFLDDFQGMEVTRAKAVLQGVVRAAHVWRDGRIELEFRQ